MKIPRRLLHLRGVRISQSLISIKEENMQLLLFTFSPFL